MPKPLVDEELCTACGVCAQVCAFHALTLIGKQVLVFQELCHGCGACFHLCPEQAIREEDHPIGQGRKGKVRGLHWSRAG